MEQQLLDVLKISFVELICLVGPLIVSGLILGIIERKANSYLFNAFGYKGILATAWLGTPVHELGHTLMCLIFGHKISDIKLLMFNQENGTLGYVSHSYNQRNIYQSAGNFFIGIAPIISGIGALSLSLYLLLPHSFSVFDAHLQSSILSQPYELAFFQKLFANSLVFSQDLFSLSNLGNPKFWLFLLPAICVSSHMALSWSDIKGAAQGLLLLFLILFIFTNVGRSFNVNTFGYILQLGRYNAYLLNFSVLALICSLFSLALSFIVYHISR